MRAIVGIGMATVAMVGSLTSPASAATFYLEPCRLEVPRKVTLRSGQLATVRTQVGYCQALNQGYLSWRFGGPTSMLFDHNPYEGTDAAGLRDRLNASAVGIYRIESGQVGQYLSGGDTYEFPMSASNAIVAKRATVARVSVRRVAGTSRVTVIGKRHGVVRINRAPVVQLWRDGRLWRNLATNRNGVALFETRARGTVQARVVESGANWSAVSQQVRLRPTSS